MLFVSIFTSPIGLGQALADLLPPPERTAPPTKQKETDLSSAIASRTETFAEEPFDEIDAVVLSTAAYFNFEKMPIASGVDIEDMTLTDAATSCKPDVLLDKSWLYDFHGRAFVNALSSSPRYADVYIADYVNDVSANDSYQFSAVTFKIDDNIVFVAFRGTDNSIAGWKEDADATYLESTASQNLALDYLEETSRMYPEARIYVGGHSKGGNMAEYAASLCSSDTWNSLEAVYDFDGPGFVTSPQGRFDTDVYNAKVAKILPQGSIFGRMFEYRSSDTFTIVRASGNVFSQHATTNWKIDAQNATFCTTDKFNKESNIASATVNEWAMSYDAEKREQLIGAFFDVVSSAGFSDWTDFKADPIGKSYAIAEEIGDLDPDVRREIIFALGRMATTLGGKVVDEF